MPLCTDLDAASNSAHACRPFALSRAVNPLLDLSRRPVIAHRGASADAPENTREAFALALAQGAEAIELDVHGTADDVPVVIHDATLERTTDHAGLVAAHTAAELRSADAGAHFTPDGGRTFPWRGRGVQVPLLAEVLEELAEVPLIIEIKDPRAQGAVRRSLVDQRATGRCMVAAEDPAALEAFSGPPFGRGASRPEIARLWLRSLAGLKLDAVGYRILAVPVRYHGLPVPTRRFVAAARQLGCPVHVWTVNDAATAVRLWRRGASGIITDRPAAILAARARVARG